MSNIGDISAIVADYMQQSAVANATRLGENLILIALNNTRRAGERQWDFSYSQIDVRLDISSTGTLISSNYLTGSTVNVAGTIFPNVTGTWAFAGFFNSLPFYTITVSTVAYFLYYTGTAWQVTAGGFSGSSKWTMTTTSTSPNGSYVPTGYTGTLFAAVNNTASVGVKRVQAVELPLSDGTFLPIEFLDNNTWIARIQRAVGRTPFNPKTTLAQLGVSNLNPIVYQQAQSLFLYPPDQFTFPLTNVKLNVVQWMPDYAIDTDSDYFCQYAPDFLQWGAILELNRFWKEFVSRQEGNITDEQIQTNYTAAWHALIQWDSSIKKGTNTPIEQMPPPPQIAPVQAQ